MKLLFATIMALTVAAAPRSCNQPKPESCYKGRLEVAGTCANYTIKVLEGANTGWTQASWTNEQTGKTHQQVFRLANPCAFPDSLEEGDTFYFTMDTGRQHLCHVCMAFYPTPQKTAAIRVLPAGCK